MLRESRPERTKRSFLVFARRWIKQGVEPIRLLSLFPGFVRFFRQALIYFRMNGAETFHLFDTYPCLHDRTATTNFDTHYFYQALWAFERILGSKVSYHVDVGSRTDYVGFVSKVAKAVFVDIRPVHVNLDRFQCIRGSILSLPFRDNSIESLSCLHVAEHIGLGRYGDPLDPQGTVKAICELSRVLNAGGNLYFSIPVGQPRLCFNAHRIFSSRQIIELFKELELVEFSGVDGLGRFWPNISVGVLDKSEYACGLFWFRKE